jgi:hypothetical protein
MNKKSLHLDEVGQQEFVFSAATNAVVGASRSARRAAAVRPRRALCVRRGQTTNQIVVIDPATAGIVRHINLDPAVGYPPASPSTHGTVWLSWPAGERHPRRWISAHPGCVRCSRLNIRCPGV